MRLAFSTSRKISWICRLCFWVGTEVRRSGLCSAAFRPAARSSARVSTPLPPPPACAVNGPGFYNNFSCFIFYCVAAEIQQLSLKYKEGSFAYISASGKRQALSGYSQHFIQKEACLVREMGIGNHQPNNINFIRRNWPER